MSNGLRERQPRDLELTEIWPPRGAATPCWGGVDVRGAPLTPLLTLLQQSPTPSATCSQSRHCLFCPPLHRRPCVETWWRTEGRARHAGIHLATSPTAAAATAAARGHVSTRCGMSCATATAFAWPFRRLLPLGPNRTPSVQFPRWQLTGPTARDGVSSAAVRHRNPPDIPAEPARTAG